MLRENNKKAQSTLEYIVILTAIVGVIIFAAAKWINPAVKNSLGEAEAAIGKAANKIAP